jgi:hypothetical protein
VLLGLVAAVAVAVAVAGCGGSGASSAERAKLTQEISAQMKGSSSPADLSTCVVRQSQGLPIAQLRKVANGGANPPPATKQLALGLVVACMKQGHGIAAIHQLIVNAFLAGPVKTLPTVFKNCIVSKANATTPAQLAQLISAYANEDAKAAQSQAQHVGEGIAARCFGAPGVINAFRPLFLAPLRRELATTSAAFRNCVIAKTKLISAKELEQFALDPSAANARGEAFGANAAKACIASGAKP